MQNRLFVCECSANSCSLFLVFQSSEMLKHESLISYTQMQIELNGTNMLDIKNIIIVAVNWMFWNMRWLPANLQCGDGGLCLFILNVTICVCLAPLHQLIIDSIWGRLSYWLFETWLIHINMIIHTHYTYTHFFLYTCRLICMTEV